MYWFRLPFHINHLYYLEGLFIAVLVLLIMRICKQHWSRCIAAALSASYLFMLLAITVFSRRHTDVNFNILPPFWAYREIVMNSARRNELIAQIIMNLLILAPLGFLLPFVTKTHPILIGISCSMMIELIQLVTKRGYFEIDDIIHNSIGILLGYWLYKTLIKRANNKKEK